MESVMKYLEGKKTYGLCALGLAIYGAHQIGWIVLDAKLVSDLMTAITLASIAALRASK